MEEEVISPEEQQLKDKQAEDEKELKISIFSLYFFILIS